ncbi:hypothetical protein AKO1_006971, partial [Acrasis kona]
MSNNTSNDYRNWIMHLFEIRTKLKDSFRIKSESKSKQRKISTISIITSLLYITISGMLTTFLFAFMIGVNDKDYNSIWHKSLLFMMAGSMLPLIAEWYSNRIGLEQKSVRDYIIMFTKEDMPKDIHLAALRDTSFSLLACVCWIPSALFIYVMHLMYPHVNCQLLCMPLHLICGYFVYQMITPIKRMYMFVWWNITQSNIHNYMDVTLCAVAHGWAIVVNVAAPLQLLFVASKLNNPNFATWLQVFSPTVALYLCLFAVIWVLQQLNKRPPSIFARYVLVRALDCVCFCTAFLTLPIVTLTLVCVMKDYTNLSSGWYHAAYMPAYVASILAACFTWWCIGLLLTVQKYDPFSVFKR